MRVAVLVLAVVASAGWSEVGGGWVSGFRGASVAHLSGGREGSEGGIAKVCVCVEVALVQLDVIW